MGKKFRQNRSISLCFRDIPIFVLNAEIQGGHQKGGGGRFLGKVASTLCRYPVGQKFRRNHSISVFEINAFFYCFHPWCPDARAGGKKFVRAVSQKP